MSGFDQNRIYTSLPLVGEGEDENVDNNEKRNYPAIDVQAYKKSFKEFLRSYQEGDFTYKYRSMLRTNYNVGQYWIEVSLQDLHQFNDDLEQKLTAYPTEVLDVVRLLFISQLYVSNFY